MVIYMKDIWKDCFAKTEDAH